MKGLDGMDTSLVIIKDKQAYCKRHGAMNKITRSGVWRCIHTYRLENRGETKPYLIENNCRAGCVIEEERD